MAGRSRVCFHAWRPESSVPPSRCLPATTPSYRFRSAPLWIAWMRSSMN
jgi:hypothetical protein